MSGPANEFAVQLQDDGGDYSAVVYMQAPSKPKLLLQLSFDLSFENRIIVAYRWLGDNQLEAVIAPQQQETY